MFPATLHELLRILRHGTAGETVTPGTPWVLETPSKSESALTVLDPDGKEVEAQVISSGRTTRLALPAATRPGFYSVKQGGATVMAQAINVDARESDTRPLPLESLKGSEGTAISVVRGEEDLLLAGRARPLWPQLAAAAAALLALEMILLAAWRRSTPMQSGGGRTQTSRKTAAKNPSSASLAARPSP
jgi:hypothetical protein